jgi:hypothetical protein
MKINVYILYITNKYLFQYKFQYLSYFTSGIPDFKMEVLSSLQELIQVFQLGIFFNQITFVFKICFQDWIYENVLH